jgi:hypothetical protein
MEKDKQTKINLITPPDKLQNVHMTFMLVYPTDDTKSQFQNLIDNFDGILNVYLYENSDDNPALMWLYDVVKYSDYVVLDLDNFPPLHKDAVSYLLAHSNVFWLTKGENIVYNSTSKNRIYNLDWLYDQIGETFETQ